VPGEYRTRNIEITSSMRYHYEYYLMCMVHDINFDQMKLNSGI